ncbi:hypothetical protein V6M85_03390 [Sulfolobus tengchongensis]|uniref:Uncharacterized protein n=1 Tax=Sulfolobus tengchongensis TaxID=207809 RepID=A0AAX4L3C7_9CREN
MTLLQLRKKQEKEEEFTPIDKLPEDYLMLECFNDWKYLRRRKKELEYNIVI